MNVNASRRDSEGSWAVDGWLRRELGHRYDRLIDETIPPELVALLCKLA